MAKLLTVGVHLCMGLSACKLYADAVVLIAGMIGTRLPAAFLVLFKGGFSWREQTFMAFSWVPKVPTDCSTTPLQRQTTSNSCINLLLYTHAKSRCTEYRCPAAIVFAIRTYRFMSSKHVMLDLSTAI